MGKLKKLRLVTKTINGVGTFGELFDGNERVCVTVERDWKNNEKSVSCIPAGTYQVRRHDSPSKGDCFSLSNPNVGVTVRGPSKREHCLIHIANFVHEVIGCIGVGTCFMTSAWGVANSAKALSMLKEKYPDGFDMEILRL